MNNVALRIESEVAAGDSIAGSLPALVLRAATQLAEATTAAEVLEAKAAAGLAYDAAKAAARFAKAKGAYDDVIGAVYRAQADALEIEAMAKRRLADEYDAAQERGELRGRGDNPRRGTHIRPSDGLKLLEVTKKLQAADIGLEHYEVYDARRLRDAESKQPGIVHQSLKALLECGEEPSKANLKREINTRLNSFSGDNEWYTPAKYIELAREVMGSIDLDPASSIKAQETVQAKTYFTKEQDGLTRDWGGRVWMNPPYSQPEVGAFAEKLATSFAAGAIEEAIVLTNSASDTAWFHRLASLASAICFPRGRIRFESPSRQSNSPAMAQTFFYFGDDADRFNIAFSEIGIVMGRFNG